MARAGWGRGARAAFKSLPHLSCLEEFSLLRRIIPHDLPNRTVAQAAVAFRQLLAGRSFTTRSDQPIISRGSLCGVWNNESETRLMSRSATDTTARSTSGERGAPKKNRLPSMP